MLTNFFMLLFMPAIAMAKPGKIITCDDTRSQTVRIPGGKVTTLNFPTTPKEAIPGEGGFDIRRIQQDLIIKAMRPGASTNLIVYLESRRCLFHLVSASYGDESLFVRDAKEKTVEVKFVN